MRNRNLAILSRSKLKMQSLSIGHKSSTSYGKPRITNQVLTTACPTALMPSCLCSVLFEWSCSGLVVYSCGLLLTSHAACNLCVGTCRPELLARYRIVLHSYLKGTRLLAYKSCRAVFLHNAHICLALAQPLHKLP